MKLTRRYVLLIILFSWSFLLGEHDLQKASFSFSELTSEDSENSDTVKYFQLPSQVALAYYHYVPENTAMATMVFIHGGGAHSQTGYQHLAQTLQEDYDVEVYLLDLRGHGLSFGRRGDSPTVEMVWEDLSAFIRMLKTTGDNPIYLAGHSSGAGLALNYSSWEAREEVDGYFFVAPEFGYKSETTKKNSTSFARVKTHKFIINSLSGGRLLGNAYAVHFNYPQSVLDNQEWMVEEITVNMAKALTPWCPKKQFTRLRVPFGLFIGDEDELFDPQKVLEFVDLSPSADIMEAVIPGETHLSILNRVGHHIGGTIETWQVN